LRRDERAALGRPLVAQGGDRLGDQLAEYRLELLGDGLVGDGGPQHGDHLIANDGVVPAVDEVAHQQLAPAAGRHRAQVRDLQIHRDGGREQARLGSEVAHDHGGVDPGLSGDGADGGLFVSARGERRPGGAEDGPAGALRSRPAGPERWSGLSCGRYRRTAVVHHGAEFTLCQRMLANAC
jgi:hypothetical protein